MKHCAFHLYRKGRHFSQQVTTNQRGFSCCRPNLRVSGIDVVSSAISLAADWIPGIARSTGNPGRASTNFLKSTVRQTMFSIRGALLLKRFLSITPGLCITRMHTANTSPTERSKENKIDELHIIMRNCRIA